MRASVFRGAGRPLSIETVDDPKPLAGQVVLKVCRCGICGTDLHRTENNLATYREGVIPGHEFSGEIVEVGSGVENLKVGDQVTALPYFGCNACVHCLQGFPVFCSSKRNIGTEDQAGAYAEYVATSAAFTLKLPPGLTFDDGALVEPMAVAVRAVNRSRIGPGSRVLVLGAGPIGLATAYWAKRAGASQVAVQASSGRRAEMAGVMGADLFIQSVDGQSPVRTALTAMGEAPDVVFECIGLPGMIDQAVATVRPHGMVVIAGACMEKDHWTPVRGLSKEVDIRFSLVYDLGEFRTAIDAFERGGVEPRAMVTQTVSLDEFPDAFEGLRARSPQCKVMLAPWASPTAAR